MDNQNPQPLLSLWDATTRMLTHTATSLKGFAVKQLQKVGAPPLDMEGKLERLQQFYNDHREFILISSAVALTFVVTKQLGKKTAEEKPKPKKTAVSIQKTFISDEDDFEEPSLFTGKTAESSEKEEIVRRGKSKILERIESSSEGEEEKIFMQMYKAYQYA